MRFTFGKQELCTLSRAQEHCFLLTNGLGGYVSVTSAYSVPRCDQGLLVAAVKAPNERITMVHRMKETLSIGGREALLSTQEFADGTPAEEGYRNLTSFVYDNGPCWTYHVSGVQVTRRCAMAYGRNASALLYTIENRSGEVCDFRAVPYLKFAPKEQAVTRRKGFTYENGLVRAGKYTLYIKTSAELAELPLDWQKLAYPQDKKDGRPGKGLACGCCALSQRVLPGETVTVEVLFSLEEEALCAETMLAEQKLRLEGLEAGIRSRDPMAKQLAVAADAFIAHRDSTNGKTILAGYPLFSDWGRDTMIALPGCTLATGRFEDAKSILRTFLAYEKDGLVPNLFPEGGNQPMYNTVDAALLLIDGVWQYVQRTGDLEFAREAWPVMERIAAYYQKGTHHHIYMEEDGLIHAGGGMDQVTWMDVCVNGILPTPRHGKPVEVNAYWYSGLRILETLAGRLGYDGTAYGQLAEKVKASFISAFYMEDKGYLKDVISGTSADEQLRCNQIWAVSMPFTMLTQEQEKNVVDAVYRHLYTPCGLRTLSPLDPEYHDTYGGPQIQRDMAYHQGTALVFPMGAYYLAYLKVQGNTPEAARYVREQLAALEPMLREGCVGQLPEIYSGGFPTESKGCFAQAWSVGEMLRVFEAIDTIEGA